MHYTMGIRVVPVVKEPYIVQVKLKSEDTNFIKRLVNSYNGKGLCVATVETQRWFRKPVVEWKAFLSPRTLPKGQYISDIYRHHNFGTVMEFKFISSDEADNAMAALNKFMRDFTEFEYQYYKEAVVEERKRNPQINKDSKSEKYVPNSKCKPYSPKYESTPSRSSNSFLSRNNNSSSNDNITNTMSTALLFSTINDSNCGSSSNDGGSSNDSGTGSSRD